jgi:hypothetical protein
MKLKVIIITLFITVPLLVNAKWIDLDCYPEKRVSISLEFESPEKPYEACTLLDRDKVIKDDMDGCYTWLIGFDSGGSAAEVENPVMKTMTYAVKKSSLAYDLTRKWADDLSTYLMKMTLYINRENLKYSWILTEKLTERSVFMKVNVGQCYLITKKTLI